MHPQSLSLHDILYGELLEISKRAHHLSYLAHFFRVRSSNRLVLVHKRFSAFAGLISDYGKKKFMKLSGKFISFYNFRSWAD